MKNEGDICSILKRIKGAWAFIYYRVCLYPSPKSQKSEHKIYFGRDAAGRRSLLLRICEMGDSIVIASCLPRDARPLPPHPAITFSPAARKAIYENELNPSCFATMDIAPLGIYSIDLSSSSLFVDLLPFNLPLSTLHFDSNCSLSQRRIAAETLLSLLEQSIRRRVSTIASLPSTRAVCMMFSGGIDCSILVCVLCRVLRTLSISCVIELANISFGSKVEAIESQSLRQLRDLYPDRYTARGSRA